MGLDSTKVKFSSDLKNMLANTFETGVVFGYDTGYDHGYEDGYNKRKKEDMPAISDGFRHGSSKCAKKMRES